VKVVIESYLTESKLVAALEQLVGDNWAGGQVILPGSRRRFDMAFRANETTLLVEYDGDDHYRDSLKIKADRQKDALAVANGMRLVRVPYWVQLDNVTVRHWFGLEADIEQSFPHGFITTKLFPASFCELGIARFQRELALLPAAVREAVIASLRDRAAKHGIEYVLPAGLHRLLTPSRNPEYAWPFEAMREAIAENRRREDEAEGDVQREF
jgi:hypothetical protein